MNYIASPFALADKQGWKLIRYCDGSNFDVLFEIISYLSVPDFDEDW